MRVVVVKPAALAKNDPTELIQSALTEAGFPVTVWSDVAQAQRHLLLEAKEAATAKRGIVVIVIDELMPDESDWIHVVDDIAYYRDEFVRWLYSALVTPIIIHIFTNNALAPFETQEEYEAYADDWVDKWFKGSPNPNELVELIRKWA